ncbi:hypothetical protein LIPSTDRAFT_227475 [Lipomyces starkeyi NRRL Y-11557]|uniref:Uncharacterized protein n=1 Tax=Lipomyces starkeyi NRRL Y-11557 TaxID=675824 RepID=A0A1E3QAN0_LIPST|nr:hypothetical protein LIPSTDRAFT_227475 [Lipomyces starkeyi NRRL Y-11557]
MVLSAYFFCVPWSYLLMRLASKYTTERFGIRAIDYDFDCEGGIFGVSIFTRLTGGSVAIILDLPRTDGLTHEQAYHELLRRLEDGDV